MSTVLVETNAKRVAKDLNISVREMRTIMHRALRDVGRSAERDYGKATRTWRHKPDVQVEVNTRGNRAEVMVGTDDKVFGWVDRGTKPHYIFPRKAKALRFWSKSRPKTQPGQLSSGSGGKGGKLLYRAWVRHPGTKPRRFTEQIQRRINKVGPKILDKAVRLWVKRQRTGRKATI